MTTTSNKTKRRARGATNGTVSDQERITCEKCKWGNLVQFYRGNVKDPLLSECERKPVELRKEREVARYHSCKDAEPWTSGAKPITWIARK